MARDNQFDWLCRPIEIGSLALKNRMVAAPASTYLASRDGYVTQRLLDHYYFKARGGAALVIVESVAIDDKASQAEVNKLYVHDKAFLQGLSELAETIKAGRARAGLQLLHAGRQRRSGPPVVAPSPIPLGVGPQGEPLPDGGPVSKELTLEEVREIALAYGRAATLVKEAGFELVEILAGHGYLIGQFLSAETNKRVDIYGGPLFNRMRFLLEVVGLVRGAVGPSLPVSVRLSASDFSPEGITLEETKETVKALARAGVDVIHVSAGTRLTNQFQTSPMFLPRGYTLPLAEEIRKVAPPSVRVIASGGINDPIFAEAALKDGKADLVSMARPLFADPELPEKVLQGRVKEIRPCIRCNECLDRTRVFKSLKCAVNFPLGFERKYSPGPAARVRDVLVVGSGPAGLEAARLAATRGHTVTLVEKEAELGGHLRLASYLPELKNLLDYYLHQMDKLKVQVILSREMDVAQIQARKPDLTIVAVGGDPIRPPIQGIDSGNVLTVLDLFNGCDLGKKVVVVGGNLIGCEAAWVLADLDKEVTIVEPGPQIPLEVERGSAAIFRQEFSRHDVKLVPGASLTRVTPQGLELACPPAPGGPAGQDRQMTIPADTIVLALGFLSRQQLINELEALSLPCRAVGDCRQPAKIFGAIHDGAMAAWEI